MKLLRDLLLRDLLLRPLQRIHLLSLDVVLGALGFMHLSSRSCGQQLPAAAWMAAGCAVWAIYLLDHLLDARRDAPLRPRRQWFARHHHILWMLWAAVCGSGAMAATQLPPALLWQGLCTAAGVGIYFLFLWKLLPLAPWLKEISIALLFATGVCLTPFSAPYPWSVWGFLLTLGYGNLLLFSERERMCDLREGIPSSASSLPHGLLRSMAVGSLLASCLLAFLTPSPLSLLAMSLLHLWLWARPSNRYYRLLADGALLLSWIGV